jgi:hypothetical protein
MYYYFVSQLVYFYGQYSYRITNWVNNSNLPVLKILKKELREQENSG